MKKEDCWYASICNNECSDTCIRYMEMKYLMDNSGIPKPQQMPLKLIPTNEDDRKVFIRLNTIKQNIGKKKYAVPYAYPLIPRIANDAYNLDFSFVCKYLINK